MSDQLTKRAFLSTPVLGAGLGLGAVALLAQTERASADTPFTNFPFAAAGTSTNRTMPDRLADIKNVLDFGADRTGTTDSQPAIQAAVDSLGVNAGTVFFPPGKYSISKPISLDNSGDNKSIILLGCGNASQIFGNFAGFLIDKASTEGGSAQYVRKVSQLYLTNSNPSGGCIRLVGSWPAQVRDCSLSGAIGIVSDQNATLDVANCKISGNGSTGGYGIAIGGESTIYKCDITGMGGDAIRASNVGGSIIGCHCKGNAGYALSMGTDSTGSRAGASGWLVSGNLLESNGGGILCNGFGFSTVAGNTILGQDANGSFAGLTIPIGGGCNYATFTNLKCYGDFGTTTNVGWSGHSIFIGFGNQGLIFRGVQSLISTPGHGTAWVLNEQDCTQFTGCNQPAPAVASFTNKPGTNGGGPMEGDLHIFTDSNTSTFGAMIAGGGTNRVVGRYSSHNGSWTVAALAP